jgi:hypothetical protein
MIRYMCLFYLRSLAFGSFLSACHIVMAWINSGASAFTHIAHLQELANGSSTCHVYVSAVWMLLIAIMPAQNAVQALCNTKQVLLQGNLCNAVGSLCGGCHRFTLV